MLSQSSVLQTKQHIISMEMLSSRLVGGGDEGVERTSHLLDIISCLDY